MAKAKRSLTAARELLSGCLKVVDVDWRTIDEGASSNLPTFDRNFLNNRNWAMVCADAQCFAMGQKNNRIVRLAQLHCGLSQRVEHGLQIKGRSADDLEHIGGGCLLLERFA